MALMSSSSLEGLIMENITGLNDRYYICTEILKVNPFETGMSAVLTNITTAVQGTAIVLTTLFFLMDFFKKTFDLQWIKWENILMFMLKFVFAKIIIENSSNIMMMIFNEFNNLAMASNPTWHFMDLSVTSIIDPEEWAFIQSLDGNWFDMTALLKWIELFPTFMIIQLVLVVTQIIIFVRLFEVTVYSMAAPIPLSSFASEEHREIGKSFLKNYAAVCLQALVIVILFAVFSHLCTFLETNATLKNLGIMSGSTGFLIRGVTLGFSVFKSGGWAKKLVGVA